MLDAEPLDQTIKPVLDIEVVRSQEAVMAQAMQRLVAISVVSDLVSLHRGVSVVHSKTGASRLTLADVEVMASTSSSVKAFRRAWAAIPGWDRDGPATCTEGLGIFGRICQEVPADDVNSPGCACWFWGVVAGKELDA